MDKNNTQMKKKHFKSLIIKFQIMWKNNLQ